MGDRAAKDALYDGFALLAKALAHGRRAEIVDVLTQGERSVEEIANEVGQSVSNTSQHLRVMARAGVLRTRRAGTHIYYRPASARVVDLWLALRDVAAEQVAEIQQLATVYLGDRRDLEIVTREELARLLKGAKVVVVDVRPDAEFRSGHIRGATSIPVERLSEEVDQLPPDSDIVAYCRGPYCVYADEAVRQLRRSGFTARRLEDGFPEWVKAGLPTSP